MTSGEAAVKANLSRASTYSLVLKRSTPSQTFSTESRGVCAPLHANAHAYMRACADECTRSSGEQTGNQFDDVLIASGAKR